MNIFKFSRHGASTGIPGMKNLRYLNPGSGNVPILDALELIINETHIFKFTYKFVEKKIL
jgi:hypothetical protein